MQFEINSSKEAILAAKPRMNEQVQFISIYQPGSWPSGAAYMSLLGEAMYIAQYFGLYPDAQKNFDWILLPHDPLNPNGYAARIMENQAVDPHAVHIAGWTAAQPNDGSTRDFEDERDPIITANEAYFKSKRVGRMRIWKLEPSLAGWAAYPKEDIYPFMSDWNKGLTIKHPAEVAIELLRGTAIKVFGNYASEKYHPQQWVISGYRQAMWRHYYRGEKFPKELSL